MRRRSRKEYTRSLHRSGNGYRVFLASEFRKTLWNTVKMVFRVDGCIVILPEEDSPSIEVRRNGYVLIFWQKRKKQRQFVYFWEVTSGKIDDHSRFFIPDKLAIKANLFREKKVLIVRSPRYIELWNSQDWEQKQQKTRRTRLKTGTP